MTKLSTSMLALTGLLTGACAGNLENPERFEQGFNPAGEGDGGGGGNAGGDANGGGNAGAIDAATPSGNGSGGNAGTGNGGNGSVDAGDGTGGSTGGGVTGSDSDAGAGGGSTGAVQPSCDVAKLLLAKCGNAGCHGSAASAAGLDLASPNLAARVKDKEASTCSDYQLIDTAEPEGSFLYLKVSETKPACGSRMPFGVPLTADEQKCILEWAQSL